MKLVTFCFCCLVLVQLISSVYSRCGSVYENSVSAAEQQQIVDAHNNYRGLIMSGAVPGQPKGKNLKTIKYDDALAKAAQDISNSCTFAHQSVTDGRWSWVGQNLYMSMSTANSNGANWPGAVESWYNEYKNYHYPDNPGSNTGHYTQLVWADTEYVGCGYTNFQDPDDSAWPYKKMYTCNYGPGGNILGQAPYEQA